MHRSTAVRVFGCLLATLAGCDSVEVLDVTPHIVVTPAKLDFGTVPVGTVVELPIEVTDLGRANLTVSNVTPKVVNDITLSSVLVEDCQAHRRSVSNPSLIGPSDCARIIVSFAPTSVETITNVIEISSDDPKTPVVDVPVTAVSTAAPQIQVCVLDASGNLVASQCTNFSMTPAFIPTLAFGDVAPSQTASRKVRITDTGNAPLSVTGLMLHQSATALSLPSAPTPPVDIGTMQSGELTVELTAPASGSVSGDLLIASNASGHPQVEIPITATVQVPCTAPTVTLSASVGSTRISGSILQNTTVSIAAAVSGGQASSYTWSLQQPPGSTSQITGSGATVTLDCTEPGTYTVGVVVTEQGGCMSQAATININVTALPPTCGPATEFIYAVGESGAMFKFQPSTATLTKLGTIDCVDPLGGTVNTMAVDANGIAWVEYSDAELFRVDTTTLQCFSTSFNPSSVSDPGWGSCFSSNTPMSSTETYFIAENSSLLTINTTTMTPSLVGKFTPAVSSMDEPELTGTPSADLYGFFPGSPWRVAQIDKTTAALSNSIPLQVISNNEPEPGNWAFASWGNDFWFFVGDGVTGTDIFHYDAATGQTTLATSTGALIVGAGVSPCVQTM